MYKIDNQTVKITGIVLEKPFKLQVAAKVSAEAANDASCFVLKGILL